VDALWKLSSLRGVIASDLTPPLTVLPQVFPRIATALRKRLDIMDFSSVVPYSRFVTYEFSKMTMRRRIPIDRTNRCCTLRRPIESKVHPYRGGFE
jgi:hypothetical protein